MSRADTFLVLKQKKENFVRNKRRWFLRCIHLLTLVVFLASGNAGIALSKMGERKAICL